MDRQEHQHVEWKQSWRDEYLKWVCGFANAQGGILIVGKNDQGNIVGIKDAKRLSEEIPNKECDVLGIMVDVNLKNEQQLEYLEIVVSVHNDRIVFWNSGQLPQDDAPMVPLLHHPMFPESRSLCATQQTLRLRNKCADLQKPHCVAGECKECDNNDHCASKNCRSDKTCAPVGSTEMVLPLDGSEQAVSENNHPDESVSPDVALEPVPEAQIEAAPEPQIEAIPEALCVTGTIRSCYPSGKIGCSADTGGRYTCKGICAVGAESCSNSVWWDNVSERPNLRRSFGMAKMTTATDRC